MFGGYNIVDCYNKMRKISIVRMFFLILLIFNDDTRGTCRRKTNSKLFNKNIYLRMYNSISSKNLEDKECAVIDIFFHKKPLVTLNFKSNVDEIDANGTKIEERIDVNLSLSVGVGSRNTFKDTNKTLDKIDHQDNEEERKKERKPIDNNDRLTQKVSQSKCKETHILGDVDDALKKCDLTPEIQKQDEIDEINKSNIVEGNNDKRTKESSIRKFNSLSTVKSETKLKGMKKMLENIDVNVNADLTVETKKQNEINDQVLNVEMNDIDGQFDMQPNTNKYGERILSFFWVDAFENFEKPGVVYMFGRILKGRMGESVSCCLIVKNIDRVIFLLPRKYKLDPITLEPTNIQITMHDLHEEFRSAADQLRIQEFRFRTVTKRSFESGVPEETEWLEIRYPSKYPSFKADKTYLTFSHVFGSNTSSLEALLLRNKIKGPSWLEVKDVNAVDVKHSRCKVEAITNMEGISVMKDLEPPHLVTISIVMKTAMDENNRQMILMLCYLVNNRFPIHTPSDTLEHQKFCLFTDHNKKNPMNFKQKFHKGIKITKFDSKEELVIEFLVEFERIDPDLVFCYDLRALSQDLIGDTTMNTSKWSRLTRLKELPEKYVRRRPFLGRLVCDLKVTAMELIKARSYDLNTLTKAILNIAGEEQDNRENVLHEDFGGFNDNNHIIQLVKLTTQDAVYIHKIVFKLNVMPIAFEITRIVGNVMSRTLLGTKSERNEFLLLHAFTEKNYIVPDKKKMLRLPRIWTKKTAAYSGGLVLDPKRGFYDKLVLLMDFNSLYPSIIQEYNICFTTVKTNDTNNLNTKSSVFGILPTQIQKLVKSRRMVKKLMNSAESIDMYKQYNTRQMALKLTANTMCGCLGYSRSRFYGKSLASLITEKGRGILMDAKAIVEKLNFEVLYGDTDSLMINTNSTDYEHALSIGQDIKRQIDIKYRYIQIGVDGVFRYLLLCRKKKYAGVLISKNKDEYVLAREYKGLDVVRRDFPILAGDAGKYVLNQIMSDQTEDKKTANVEIYLKTIKKELKSGMTPISKLIMTKRLARDPDEYYLKYAEYADFMPQVQVATRLNVKASRRFKKGDMVPYIICEDGTERSAMQRAYHVEEMNKSAVLKVDYQYYLVQLHSVIAHLSENINYFTPARIAQYLGMNAMCSNANNQKICKIVNRFNRNKKLGRCFLNEVLFLCVN